MRRKDLSKFTDPIEKCVPVAKRKKEELSYKTFFLIIAIYLAIAVFISLYFIFLYPRTHEGVTNEKIRSFLLIWGIVLVILTAVSLTYYFKRLKWNHNHLDLVPIELINENVIKINDSELPMYLKLSFISNIYKEKNDCIGFLLKDGTTVHASELEDKDDTYEKIRDFVENKNKNDNKDEVEKFLK